MKRLKKMIDAAFTQSMNLVCERLGLNPIEMTILVKFIGTKINLTVCENDKPIKQINLQSLIGSKFVGLRFTSEELRCIFRSIQFAFSTGEELDNADDISLILYDSKKAAKPCVGICIRDEPNKSMALSEIVDVLGIGVEQMN